MRTRRQLEAENEMLKRKAEVLDSELDDAYREICELRKENYALQIDLDMIESGARHIATRKAAEVVNEILARETQTETPSYSRIVSTYRNDAEMFADAYAKAHEEKFD